MGNLGRLEGKNERNLGWLGRKNAGNLGGENKHFRADRGKKVGYGGDTSLF